MHMALTTIQPFHWSQLTSALWYFGGYLRGTSQPAQTIVLCSEAVVNVHMSRACGQWITHSSAQKAT